MTDDDSQKSSRKHQRIAFSQFGEDAVLAWLFHDKTGGFYVDIGCHHPHRISNTALLHQDRGWHGLNIDVDERAIAAFDQYRPNDINVCVGVAGSPGTKEVTIFEEGAINTFDEASAAHPAWSAIARQKRYVHVDTLASLLSKYVPLGTQIDLLDLDAEGLDYEILTSNDWDKFKPQVILVEAEVPDLADLANSPTHLFLREQGYRLVSHTAITSFYRR